MHHADVIAIEGESYRAREADAQAKPAARARRLRLRPSPPTPPTLTERPGPGQSRTAHSLRRFAAGGLFIIAAVLRTRQQTIARNLRCWVECSRKSSSCTVVTADATRAKVGAWMATG